MFPPLGSAAFSRRTALGLALLALTVLAACNSGNGDVEPTATEPEATAPAATATPDIGQPSEMGESPIFWRTADEFGSLRVGQPYKVLFRVTSGYAEATLPISAECSDCAEPVPGGTLEFEPRQPDVVSEEEAPGSYYPFNLDLPQPGTWVVTITAGDDTASITVEVKPAAD